MMMWKIVFARIDDRLIHGQVMTRWMKGFPKASIVIIDDELAVDEFMKNIYTMAAPPGVKVKVFGVDAALKEWSQKTSVEEEVFLLFKNIDTCKRVMDGGLPIATLNIGGVAKTPQRKGISQSVSLSEDEVKTLLELKTKYNVDVYLQMIPDSEKIHLTTVVEKYFPELK
jgi:PTS system mannose-specific IIB component